MVDKNLFLYDLAITAIFKDEGKYLKEWIDYHLVAGVEHFYLYNNDSSDDYAEVLAPYIEKNLVTLTDVPGKMMQYPAYDDAIQKYRFECRYMAFIDIDEFIYPKTMRSIPDVIDEALSHDENAAGFGINWQCFGSNGKNKADYSLGVLERFKRRAQKDWSNSSGDSGNLFRKTIDNPRLIQYRLNPHFAIYLRGKTAINSNGEYISTVYYNKPILTDKIVINHYHVKSKEEFLLKQKKGRATGNTRGLPMSNFHDFNRNEVFDDGILKYRDKREEDFSLESDDSRNNRVVNALVQTLTQTLAQTSLEDSFVDKMETFLTCRALAEKFEIKIGDRFAEEYALALIYQTLVKANPLSITEIQQFIKALPEILSRPFSICKKINTLAQENVIPRLCEYLKNGDVMKSFSDWTWRADMVYIQQLLKLIK